MRDKAAEWPSESERRKGIERERKRESERARAKAGERVCES